MAIYLFSQILKFTKYSIKLIEKVSRRHLINSSDVFVIKGFTVCGQILQDSLIIHRGNVLYVSNESERNFPQDCILSSTTLHSRSVPLSKITH